MKLRYVELPPSRIYNWLAPQNCTAWLNVPQWREIWWTAEGIGLRDSFARIWTNEFDDITQHFTNLRKSIKEEGIRKPISLISGPMRNQQLTEIKPMNNNIPLQYRDNINELLYTHPFGGSRITVAEELGIELIPCLVHDFSNLFPNAPIVNELNYRTWCGYDYTFVNSPPYIRNSHHCHLTEGKYNGMNNETRIAQQLATKRTKEKMNV